MVVWGINAWLNRKMTETSAVSIRYYNWEGDACRVYCHENGDMTADIYRPGEGPLETEPGHIIYGSRPIGESEYKEMVLRKIALYGRKAQG